MVVVLSGRGECKCAKDKDTRLGFSFGCVIFAGVVGFMLYVEDVFGIVNVVKQVVMVLVENPSPGCSMKLFWLKKSSPFGLCKRKDSVAVLLQLFLCILVKVLLFHEGDKAIHASIGVVTLVSSGAEAKPRQGRACFGKKVPHTSSCRARASSSDSRTNDQYRFVCVELRVERFVWFRKRETRARKWRGAIILQRQA